MDALTFVFGTVLSVAVFWLLAGRLDGFEQFDAGEAPGRAEPPAGVR